MPDMIRLTLVIPVMLATASACQTTPAPQPTSHRFPKSPSGFATLHGRLVLTNPLGVAPARNGIFLIPIVSGPADPSAPLVAGAGQSPQADVDETTGEFVILNVQPGRYRVAVQTESGFQVSARDYRTGEPATITVRDVDLNRTLEVGTIRIP